MTGSFGESGFGCVEFLPPGFEQIPVKAQAFAWSGLPRARDRTIKRVLSERPGRKPGDLRNLVDWNPSPPIQLRKQRFHFHARIPFHVRKSLHTIFQRNHKANQNECKASEWRKTLHSRKIFKAFLDRFLTVAFSPSTRQLITFEKFSDAEKIA
jgi:hypothetical protein